MSYKNLANKILAGVFSLFLLSIWLRHVYKDILMIEMFYAVMEAALVGGIADWFAITAIFRKPLGFPWHTALIPRHRDRLILAITDMIEQDLLSIKSIKKRVDGVCFVAIMIDWIDHKDGKPFLKGLLEQYSRDLMMKIDIPAVAGYVENFIKAKMIEMKITPQIQAFTKWGLEQGKDKDVMLFILDELIHIVKKPDTRRVIYRYMEGIKQSQTKSLLEKAVIWIGEQTNSVNVSDAADALYEELLITLQEMKNPEHILRKWIHGKLIGIANRPVDEIPWADELEHWKTALVEGAELTDIVISLTENVMEQASTSAHVHLLEWIYSQANQHWDRFKTDGEMQNWLEDRIKQAIFQLIENEHYLIGTIVQEVLGTFTDEDLNRFIEEKAGNDLQWIRINGCIIGAFVGGIIFAASMIQNWFGK